MGAAFTTGVTERHDKVTLPEYPATGVTWIEAVAPLPAVTVLGLTGVEIVKV